ncbi:MAG: Bifunctional oligoribonuclease and PAP phosphatase NrnA [Phycisphaerae bacterium]|nr:Bifunctional oligoribonuclease and PAP phosphatase NrnA [Phycisphaerae bacterium]
MKDVPDNISVVISALQKAARPVVAAHVTPDADALGSMLALGLGLQAAGTPVRIALPAESVSQKLQFMVALAELPVATVEQCQTAERLVVCDTAKVKRINLPDHLQRLIPQEFSPAIINIDHHASNEQFGVVNWVDAHASSSSELICRIYQAAGWPLTPVAATLLYAGILGDTVGFSLPNSTAATLSAAADLVAAGADIALVGLKLCRSQTRSEFDLRRIIYDNTRIIADGRIAYSTASYEEITRAGCRAADIDDQVEIPRSLAGVQLAMLLTEGEPGRIRFNLRSNNHLSILELAQQLGGGGHHAAAGAIIKCSLPDALARILPMAEQFLQNLHQVNDSL